MNVYLVFAASTYLLRIYVAGVITVDPEEAQLLQETCGTTRYDNKTITLFNTTDYKSQIGRFPWLVRLGVVTPENMMYFYCTGSLITKTYVLSAAHCGTHAEIARLGENNDDGFDCFYCLCPPQPQDIPIRTHLQGDHCRMSNKNDIMVLALERQVQFDDFIRPICLPEYPQLFSEIKTQLLLTVGWGTVYSGFGKVPPEDAGDDYDDYEDMQEANNNKRNTNNKLRNMDNNLRYMKVSLLDPDECSNVYQYRMEPKKQYCVKYTRLSEKPCVADSGSPLIAYRMLQGQKRAFVEGIASYDLTMCEYDINRPLVYTNVGIFTEFTVLLMMSDQLLNNEKTSMVKTNKV